ncbi:MAG: hypothetical protein RIM80_11895 [Alphaproteobacteria bacterium]
MQFSRFRRVAVLATVLAAGLAAAASGPATAATIEVRGAGTVGGVDARVAGLGVAPGDAIGFRIVYDDAVADTNVADPTRGTYPAVGLFEMQWGAFSATGGGSIFVTDFASNDNLSFEQNAGQNLSNNAGAFGVTFDGMRIFFNTLRGDAFSGDALAGLDLASIGVQNITTQVLFRDSANDLFVGFNGVIDLSSLSVEGATAAVPAPPAFAGAIAVAAVLASLGRRRRRTAVQA